MRKILRSATAIYVSLALIFSIATTAFATSSVFDFTSSLATVHKVGNIHSITMNSNFAYTMCTASDLSFRFRITSNNYSWLGLSLDNTGANGLGAGTGIRSVLFFGDNGAVITRVVDTPSGRGWDAATAQQLHGTQLGTASDPTYNFKDGNWHTVTVKETTDVWSMEVDGKSVMTSKYAGADAELTTKLSGNNSTYLVLYTDSGSGSLDIEQITAAPTDKPSLFTELTTAKAQRDAVTIGTTAGNYPQSAYDTFNSVIASAQAVYDNVSATPTDISNAITALRNAEYTFSTSVIVAVDRSSLEDMLESAELLLAKVVAGTAAGKAPQSALDAFNLAYNSAVSVKNNADATKQQIDNATKSLKNAMNTFISQIVPFTDEQKPFEFSGKAIIAGKDPASINIIDDVVTLDMPDTGSTAHSVVTATKLEFCFKIDPDVNCQWFGIILSNSGWTSLGGGDGITCLLWNNSNGVTCRLVEQRTGKGWEGAANKQFSNGNLTVDEMVFNDGEWHTFKLIRETTGWEMTIDDYNCINAPYDDLNLDLDRLLGPQSTVTMSVFTNGDPAKLSISQNPTVKSSANLDSLEALYNSSRELLEDVGTEDCSFAGLTNFTNALDETHIFMQRTDLTAKLIDEQIIKLKKALNIFKADIITTYNSKLPTEVNDPIPSVIYEINRLISGDENTDNNSEDSSENTTDKDMHLPNTNSVFDIAFAVLLSFLSGVVLFVTTIGLIKNRRKNNCY